MADKPDYTKMFGIGRGPERDYSQMEFPSLPTAKLLKEVLGDPDLKSYSIEQQGSGEPEIKVDKGDGKTYTHTWTPSSDSILPGMSGAVTKITYIDEDGNEIEALGEVKSFKIDLSSDAEEEKAAEAPKPEAEIYEPKRRKFKEE